MDVILIPGLWLDASSWDDIVDPLREAGHTPHALTLPGVGVAAPESSDIGIAEWIEAVVTAIDGTDGDVVLVGHSGGGNVAWAATEARAGRVARVVFVDTTPPPPGAEISELPVLHGVVPFPGWDFFDEEDVADLAPEVRERTAPTTRSVPARVPTDPLPLSGGARHAVPVTMLMGGMDEETFRRVVQQWGAFAAEFDAIEDATVVTLGTGHWPQFSAPDRLARALLAAIG